MLREARARGIQTIGMVRSWDNLSVNKGNIRINPDKLLVHNKYLFRDAVELADFPKERIQIVGMPHFDYYVNESRLSREEISKKLGTNPNKKIILFLMIGLSGEGLDEYVASVIEKWIKKDRAFKGFELIIRPHPNTAKSVKAEENTKVNYPEVIEFKSDRITDREFTKQDLDMYASLIAYSSVVISYQGTSIVDAVALGKPIICIAFDEAKDLPYLAGIKHQYQYSHLQPVLDTGGVKIVYDEEELKKAIIDYDLHPEHDIEARKKIVEEQCFKLDGKASYRVVEEIKKTLQQI
jgi:UDP-N-acetylglucosamine:LPS N-acetylglucosamine transferase